MAVTNALLHREGGGIRRADPCPDKTEASILTASWIGSRMLARIIAMRCLL